VRLRGPDIKGPKNFDSDHKGTCNAVRVCDTAPLRDFKLKKKEMGCIYAHPHHFSVESDLLLFDIYFSLNNHVSKVPVLVPTSCFYHKNHT
jgi:hypothetical protein